VCSQGTKIELGVLSGDDAKAFAHGLSTVFAPESIVVTVLTEPDGDSQQDENAKVNEEQPVGSKKESAPAKTFLCVAPRVGVSKPVAADKVDILREIVALADNDNISGLGFDSNYVIRLDKLCTQNVATAFPHPAPGLDMRQIAQSSYLILIPSFRIPGRTSDMHKALGEQAAAVKHDLESLDKQCVPQAGDSTLANRLAAVSPADEDVELWFAQHTTTLAALDPREVALKLRAPFCGQHLQIRVWMKAHAVTILPDGMPSSPALLAADALERDTLFHQEEEERKWFQGAQEAPGGGETAGSSPVRTSTKSTTTTTITPATAKNPSVAVAVTTTTSSPSTPQGPQDESMADAAPTSYKGEQQSTPKADSGVGKAGGQAKSSTGSGKTGEISQKAPSQEEWSLDRVVRLYHIRQAKDVADVINKSSPSNAGQDLVEPLNDDLLVILPPAPGQPDRFSAIHRAIAMLDLPRPQLSLQVWSVQISGKAVNANDRENLTKSSKLLQDTFMGLRGQVLEANDRMTEALQSGFGEIVKEAWTNPGSYFEPDFTQYLIGRYGNCVKRDIYCLGYHDALVVPRPTPSAAPVNASLSRLLLFLAAAKDDEAPKAVQAVITAMQGQQQCDPNTQNPQHICFPEFSKRLCSVAQPHNLHLLRAALLDFLFQYKWIHVYPNDFVPYDLQTTAHVLDSLFAPIVDAFDEDVDYYVQAKLRKAMGDHNKKTNFASRGSVEVATLSGTKASVSGKVNNYFDITPPLSLGDIVNSDATKSQDTGLAAALKGVLEPKEITVVQALTNIAAKPRITAEVSREATLTITPTTLDTASSASLDLDFDVKDQTAPQTVNQSSSRKDLLDRVADQHITDHVRVESLKLFDISSFTMDLTHSQPPWTIPLLGDLWKAVFGTIPVFGKLFEFPLPPTTVENRSIAIVRAVVVPTAMDLGLSLPFESDRVFDPATGTMDPLFSLKQIGEKIRPFHKTLMKCIVDGKDLNGNELLTSAKTECLQALKLSETQEDLR
jgi:hypothetical protein